MALRQIIELSTETLAREFFEKSVGTWNSQRRYYTLKPDVATEEVVSVITIEFLEQGCPQLIELAQAHHLEDKTALTFGSYVTWESNYTAKVSKPTQGSTLFGVLDNILYRDRGFATQDPIKANYSMTNSQTLCLRTEYNRSVFEEEIKLIGENYRTRQTIMSRAGEEIMIGQYLEKRITE
ncbi:conserved hypothetical protein [Rippkaea orientalis PCC 8801]|uniref:Chromophore lyase CpcS/CpeS n=1 Tax=Rippkaea orientalis (strain PCC 8801 / RF-1) TaxID=41431 RepID=B7K1X9_RIPO1|nr:phycobiliprotein lyase [Rippkaea orientalis]ACK64286.1 conserved hypothetical protein [Rippkaea orientalis PCC 8801]